MLYSTHQMPLLRSLRTPLDLPIALFLISALIGVWASYDPATSWLKFVMVVAAVAAYYVLAALRAAPQLLETCIWLFLFGCCTLTLYFVTQHDYATHPGKFGFITALGMALNRISPQLGRHVFDPNITSGALEIGLPVAVALVAGQKGKATPALAGGPTGGPSGSAREKQNGLSLSASLLASLSVLAIIAFGLLMTSSRGAWLALGVVGGIAVLVIVAKDVLRRYALPISLIVVLIALIVVIRLGDLFVPALESVLGTIPAGDSAISRVELWGQARGLIQDYYISGSGLGVFPMILSTYALLIDVPFLTHVHNLFLQIWLEQGLLGFVAFVWLVIAFYFWVWNRRYSMSWLAWGGVAAATVMLLHGMVDVLLYSSRGLPMMLVPFGLAVSGQKWNAGSERLIECRAPGAEHRGWKAQGVAYCLLPAAFCLFFFSSLILRPSSFAAMWYANLGSVEQARVELGQYRWPDRLVGDVRKNCGLSNSDCGLQVAEDHFHQALALDAWNETANQRLAAIALAKGSLDDAQALLGQAYERDPSSGVTNRLIGLVSRQ